MRHHRLKLLRDVFGPIGVGRRGADQLLAREAEHLLKGFVHVENLSFAVGDAKARQSRLGNGAAERVFDFEAFGKAVFLSLHADKEQKSEKKNRTESADEPHGERRLFKKSGAVARRHKAQAREVIEGERHFDLNVAHVNRVLRDGEEGIAVQEEVELIRPIVEQIDNARDEVREVDARDEDLVGQSRRHGEVREELVRGVEHVGDGENRRVALERLRDRLSRVGVLEGRALVAALGPRRHGIVPAAKHREVARRNHDFGHFAAVLHEVRGGEFGARHLASHVRNVHETKARLHEKFRRAEEPRLHSLRDEVGRLLQAHGFSTLLGREEKDDGRKEGHRKKGDRGPPSPGGDAARADAAVRVSEGAEGLSDFLIRVKRSHKCAVRLGEPSFYSVRES